MDFQTGYFFSETACAVVFVDGEAVYTLLFRTPELMAAYVAGDPIVEHKDCYQVALPMPVTSLENGHHARFCDLMTVILWGKNETQE